MASNMRNPQKGHEALRRGRLSLAGATYFLTICTEGQRVGLEAPVLTAEILAMTRDSACGWEVRSGAIMPDHVHLVVRLKESSVLPGAIRLFKGRTSVSLRRHQLKWERGYYDHRLRCDEDVWPVLLYVFLNPYRANLLPVSEPWSGYYCCPEDWEWFGPRTNQACPFPEWLR